MSYAGPAVRRDSGKTAALAGALLIGAAVGAGIALLLAPESGRATRHKLSRLSRGGRRWIRNQRKSLRRFAASSL